MLDPVLEFFIGVVYIGTIAILIFEIIRLSIAEWKYVHRSSGSAGLPARDPGED